MKRWLLVFLVACGSDQGGGPIDAQPADAAAENVSDVALDVPEEPAGPFPFVSFDLPRLVTQGGPVLTAPKIVPVFFANEDGAKATAVMDFLSKLPSSAYWAATTKGGGVSSLVIAPAVMLTENAPSSITDSQIDAWVSSALASSKLPANEPSKTIYVLYYPQTTTVTFGSLVSCTGFGGYHSEIAGAVYAEVNGCASYGAKLAPGETVTGIDMTTGLTTHEILEAVTDPFVKTAPAWASIDTTHHAWTLYLYGGEIADTCEMQPGAFYKDPSIGYVVQRMWSNLAADANEDPCVPAAGAPFVSAWPVNGAIPMQIGDTTTVTIQVASSAPTAPIDVTAIDESSAHGKAQRLQLSLDKTTAKNGDTLTLTLKLVSTDPTKYEGYWIETELAGVKRRTAGLVFQ